MAILSQTRRNSVLQKLVALTPLNLYIERAKSISQQLRASSAGLSYTPLQFGGINGQQESLKANAIVRLVDFNITGTE
jgi:hypothetical protein